jgi:acyl-CoA dehydrogenase
MTTVSDQCDELAAIRQLADNIMSAATEPVLDAQRREVPFDPQLWKTLAESGLTLLTTPESAGGSGAGLRELAPVLEQAGYHAAPIPLAEHDLLAAWLLRTVGLPLTGGPATAALTSTTLDGKRLATTLKSVPWARNAEQLVIAGPGFVATLPRDAVTITECDDLAAQPADDVAVDAVLDEDRLRSTTADASEAFRHRGALARALQTCGALTRALELTGAHVTERVQFGRPLAKFQAVQALVANGASAVCLARSACDFAVQMAEIHGFDSAPAQFAVAVAKIESCRATTVVARNTHQAHGAIGFTLDHRLRHFTTRALAWRSEFGNARQWQHQLGAMLLGSRLSAWEFVTTMSSGH